jgi:ATP-binding cassette subfamily B protein
MPRRERVTEQPPEHRPFTAADFGGPENRRSAIRRTPAMTVDSLRFVRRADPKHLVAVLALQVLSALSVALQLLVARQIITALVSFSQGGEASQLYRPFALFIVVLMANNLITASIGHQRSLLTEFVGRYAFDQIIRVASRVPFALLETPRFYDQLQRAMASGTTRVLGMVTALTQLGTGVITSIGIAGVLLFIEPLLVLLIFAAALPPLLASVINSGASYQFQYALTPEGRERSYLMNVITTRDAAKELRLMGLADHLAERYQILNEFRLRLLQEFLGKRFRVTLLGSFANAIGMAIALGALIWMLSTGRLGVANALTAAVAMQQLASRFTGVIGSITQLIESAMFLDDFKSFMALAPPAEDDRPKGERAISAGPARDVRFENVSFTYQDHSERVLDDISLEIGEGEVVALVGANGSGKTTLVKLLCQLYEPTEGTVSWNGTDTRELGLEAVAEEVTTLFQDYVKYHLTAMDNIVFGRIDRADDEQAAVAAAEQTGADRVINKLPKGYDTRLGLQFNGGTELSGGQWQRLALARAFFRDASLLILDEPTASLDARAEHELFSQMQRLAEGRSVLLISHRFSSVRSADRIYVLEHGRIIESGSHDALMALGGHYAELFKLQAAAYLEPSTPLDG